MSEYEAHISGWEEDGEPKKLRPLSPQDIANVLDDFSERTEEVIATIPETTGIAAFQSDDIGESLRFGSLAVSLAAELRKIGVMPEVESDQVSGEIPDDTIHSWINGDE